MTMIIIPPDLETRLADEARRRGTTPELLAIDGLRQLFAPAPAEAPRSFGERFAQFKGAVPGLPTDLAEQHDHYRLGTPKR